MIELSVPLPPAQSGAKGWRSQWQKTHATKSRTWISAVAQLEPLRDPPTRVRVDLYFTVKRKRDNTNLWGDAKPVLDALKQRHNPRDRLRWRGGLYLDRGYYYDDDHMELGDCEQVTDSKRPGLRIVITPLDNGGE